MTSGHTPSGIKHFVVLSSLSGDILRPYLPPDAVLHHVANPVSVPRQAPVPAAGNSLFVAVGRLVPEKGPIIFAEAAHSAGIAATFVGDGECRGNIQHLFPEATVTGWQSRDDLLAHMRRARALVLPSLWYEVQPLVVLEAAALGIPAIVPDTSAAREAVVDGVTGLWFKGGSVNDLAAKIRMLGDDAMVANMGREAYERFWADPPTLDRHVSRLHEVYSQVLAAHPHTTHRTSLLHRT